VTLGQLAPLLDTSQAEELARQFTPLQLGVFGILLIVLVLALAKRLVKTAVVFAIVALAIYGNSQGWFASI
jgi:hypothetical protein